MTFAIVWKLLIVAYSTGTITKIANDICSHVSEIYQLV